ncbi:PilW family protein [Comamonas sp.]|uniref:PilW family protein n=1 Tax=Comamonas sp. TaxID=34028 RepID=UPI003A8CEF41
MTASFSHHGTTRRSIQQGITLIELMVGIALGLLAIAVAMGALLASKNASTTTSDSTTMQQQAAFFFRTIGLQIRQAGSRSLLPPSGSYGTAAYFNQVSTLQNYTPISGVASPGTNDYLLTTSYQNAIDDKRYTSSSTTTGPLIKNCLGENPTSSPADVLQSAFKLDGNTLYCAGTASKQPLIGGDSATDVKVKDFQVRYLTQTGSSNPTFTYATANQITNRAAWLQVQAVEICIELEGTENIDTVGASYINCSNTSVLRANRLRSVFRNTFRIRSHAW